MAVIFSEVNRSFYGTPEQTQSQPTMTDMLIATSKAIDLVEGRPWRHGIKVAAIAGATAKELGFGDREITAVVYAGLLHDVGLALIASEFVDQLAMGTSEKEIFYAHTLLATGLANPRDMGETILSAEAERLLKCHPERAMQFIRDLRLSEDVGIIIQNHHELCNGSGYPKGLFRDDIPIGARLVAFADTIEAILQEVTNGIPSKLSALETFLDEKAPIAFDHEVIKAFRNLLINDIFLRQLYSLEAEDLIHQLVSDRSSGLNGRSLLHIAKQLSTLPDRLLPGYTDNHSETVAQIASKIAMRLEIPQEQSGQLVLAGYLHDLGKLAIPVSALKKAGPLTEEEWAVVHNHPHHSGEILKNIPCFQNITTWVSEHHERMNARGYPGGLKSTDISVGGRIIAIADVFESLTAVRPYRPNRYTPEDALPILTQSAYRLYDNRLVNVLNAMIEEECLPEAQPKTPSTSTFETQGVYVYR